VILKLEGYENLPQTGAILVTTAHTSRLDTIFLMVASNRRDGIPLVATEYKKSIMGPLLDAVGVIWIDRSGTDFTALQKVGEYLKKGWMLGIAPEGKRSRTKLLMQDYVPYCRLVATGKKGFLCRLSEASGIARRKECQTDRGKP